MCMCVREEKRERGSVLDRLGHVMLHSVSGHQSERACGCV